MPSATRRSREITRLIASSPTMRPSQQDWTRSSRETIAPSARSRQTSTCITRGSTISVASPRTISRVAGRTIRSPGSKGGVCARSIRSPSLMPRPFPVIATIPQFGAAGQPLSFRAGDPRSTSVLQAMADVRMSPHPRRDVPDKARARPVETRSCVSTLSTSNQETALFRHSLQGQRDDGLRFPLGLDRGHPQNQPKGETSCRTKTKPI